MAGVCSKADSKEIELFMTCCLGDHLLQNPKLLPCRHSFCMDCIQAKIGKEQRDFVCPKCQLSIPLTEKEVNKLPEDVLYHIIQETKDSAECVTCTFEDKKNAGTFQCLDCADVLCGECKVGHTKSSLTRFHRVVSVKDIQEGKYKNNIQPEKQLLCDTHSKPNKPKELEYYCEQCKCLVCYMCLQKSHKEHNYKHTDEMSDEKATTVTKHVIELMDFRKIVAEFAAVLENELGQNKEFKEKLVNEVYERATNFIDIIEKVKENTLKSIKGHFEKEDTSMQTKLYEAENRLIRIDSIVNYNQAFLKHSGKAQFLQHENEIMKRLAEQKQHRMNTTFKRNIFELCQPQFAETEAIITEAFGNIKTKTGTLGNSVPRQLMQEPEVLFHTPVEGSYVFGITVAMNEDIVAIVDGSIQVYNSDGKHKEKIQCNQLQNPWNVVAKGDTLYVSESGNEKVHVIDFKGNVKKTITLPHTGQIYGAKGLAIDDEGNVFISSYNTNTVYKCEPDQTNAKVFIQEGTHPDLKGPRYLCVTPGGEVVVSNDTSKTIQMYDRRGAFLWQYKGQGDMALNNPRGICCDKDGYIYVAECFSQKIHMLKDEVSIGFLTKKDFNQPYSLAIDKDDNLVCGSHGDIFKVKCWSDDS